MKVSIITVCFNSERTIEDTLKSISCQSYDNIEHVVIDGGSSDRTVSIIENYKLHDLVFLSEPDQGIYDAFNKGLHFATGDIVGFLNSDDQFYSDTVVEKIVRSFEEFDIDGIYGDVIYFKGNDPSSVRRLYKSKKFDKRKLKFGLMPAHPSLYVKRRCYEKVGGFKTHFRIAGDFEFICRYFGLQEFKSIYIEEIFVKMRMGGATAITFSNILKINKEIRQACAENGIKTTYINLYRRYFSKILEFGIFFSKN